MSDELKFVDIKVRKVGLVYIQEVPARIRPGVSGWIRFGRRSRRAKWKDRRAQRAVGRMLAYAKHVRKKVMRALSLTQPWATFVARGLKPVENRKQYFAEIISGEPFAIHASMNWDSDAVERIKRIAAGDQMLLEVLGGPHVRGAILGVASASSYLRGFEGLDQTVHRFTGREGVGVACNDDALLRWYFTTQYGYVLHDQVALAEPLPCKGALGFWSMPLGALTDLERRLAAMNERTDH